MPVDTKRFCPRPAAQIHFNVFIPRHIIIFLPRPVLPHLMIVLRMQVRQIQLLRFFRHIAYIGEFTDKGHLSSVKRHLNVRSGPPQILFSCVIFPVGTQIAFAGKQPVIIDPQPVGIAPPCFSLPYKLLPSYRHGNSFIQHALPSTYDLHTVPFCIHVPALGPFSKRTDHTGLDSRDTVFISIQNLPCLTDML